MKKIMLASGLMLMAFSVSASGLSCDELKAKIEKKVTGKGVKDYTLTVVEKDAKSTSRVVGTCEAGHKKIIYERVKSKTGMQKAS